MKVISLFSGIGGFELAAEWMGWQPIVSCEINPFGRKVLNHYWPNAYHHDDIHTLTIEKINEKIGTEWQSDDIVLTGGFPCQPYSTAGKRLGKDDERHLWPQMLRIIQEVKPTYIVGENVRGLVNWNGGVVFDEVQTDLENAGYEVIPFIIPACAVGAPHRRDRVWFVAHATSSTKGSPGSRGESKSNRRNNNDEQSCGGTAPELYNGCGEFLRTTQNTERDGCLFRESEQEGTEDGEHRNIGAGNTIGVCGEPLAGTSSNTKSKGGERLYKRKEQAHPIIGSYGEHGTSADTNGRRQPSEEHGQAQPGQFTETSLQNNWQNFPTQSPLRSRNDGFSERLDGITFPKWRNESIKAAGNAIVPQVAYQIFKSIQEIHNRK